MGRFLRHLGLVAVVVAASAQSPAADALARAREHFNQQLFDDAIAAASLARETPETANAAAVVLARAYLERFRLAGNIADLDAARAELKAVNRVALEPRDEVEWLVGLGLAVFLDERDGIDNRYSAAAEFFEQALARADAAPVAPRARERILEWWANALDRQAQFGPGARRPALYARILDRMERELARAAPTPIALYWKAAAARGVGDLDQAWGAAVAGWIQARELGERGTALRADLERLVVDVLLPERALDLTPQGDPRPTLALLQAEWAEIKEKWR